MEDRRLIAEKFVEFEALLRQFYFIEPRGGEIAWLRDVRAKR
jgi:hypothetical protein